MCIRQMVESDLDEADRIARVAFGTHRGLPDPSATFGEAQYVRTRFRAAPDCAWTAVLEGRVVGSIFAARWGSFGFLGPLSVSPEHWDQRIGSQLMEPVMDTFDRWRTQQAGLFTFADSPKHLGLYQKFGFWPRFLTVVMSKPVEASPEAMPTLFSQVSEERRPAALEETRELTDAVFAGLDLEREILAVSTQAIGDTVLVQGGDRLEGMAVCHCGSGSEAEADSCYVKFGAVRPGVEAADAFERLLDASEAFAERSGAKRLVAGVNTGRLDAYRQLWRRGFRTDRVGVSMRLYPDRPDFDTPNHYVVDDLR